MKSSRKKNFYINTLILFTGKFANQLVAFLLLPLFTWRLNVSDYGYVDLIQSYISLLLPLFLLQIDSGIFRYLIDERENDDGIKEIISSSFIILLSSTLFFVILLVLFNCLYNVKYFIWIIVNVIVQIFNNYLMAILRGEGKNKNYAVSAIIIAITTLILNLVLILIYNFDAISIIISSSIASAFSIIYCIYIIKIHKYLSIDRINKKTCRKLFKYSIPMIPNALSWWIVNLSDRIVISHIISTAANGIYSISCKFSNLINSIWAVFSMSWQEFVSLHIKDDDSSSLISEMGNQLLLIFGSISLLIISFLPIVYNIIIGNEYLEAYKYIPVLLFSNVLCVFSGIIGGIYVGLKKTKEIATTTIISAVCNIVLNIAFIKLIGLWAAVISTFISYFIICIYRYYDCQKYIVFKINVNKSIVFFVVYSFSTILYLYNNIYTNIINVFIVMIYSIFTNHKYLKNMKVFFRK